MQSFLTAIRFLVKVTVTVTIEPAVMLLLSSSSRTAKTEGQSEKELSIQKFHNNKFRVSTVALRCICGNHCKLTGCIEDSVSQ